MKAHVVVDLCFGDSGKGITVDSLCIEAKDPIVVRHSGGQQCGHTVYIDKYTSHIHSSFGSGTLRGVPSYFSEHCTMYLNTLVSEFHELQGKGCSPDLTIHPKALVTTPYDVAWNRCCSQTKSHGTVGLGVGATMTRHLSTGYKLYVNDFLYPDLMRVKLKQIEAYYLKLLKDEEAIQEYLEHLKNELETFESQLNSVSLYFNIKDYSHLLDYKEIIFEGSQGVMLDMDHGIFPNVTYANTTSKNAEEVLSILRDRYKTFCNTRYYLVTRGYTTRHGNGWMPNEQQQVELTNTHMEINEFDEYQGIFRVSAYEPQMIDQAIRTVCLYSPLSIENSRLLITCLDQINYEDEQAALGLTKVIPVNSKTPFLMRACEPVESGHIVATLRRSHISSTFK